MTDTTDTPEIAAARDELREAEAAYKVASAVARDAAEALAREEMLEAVEWDAALIAAQKLAAAERRHKDLIAAAKKEPTP